MAGPAVQKPARLPRDHSYVHDKLIEQSSCPLYNIAIDVTSRSPVPPGLLQQFVNNNMHRWVPQWQLSTWNARGLFAVDPKARQRKFRRLRSLLSRFDVLGVQESHFDPDMSGPMLPQLCSHLKVQAFFSGYSQAEGGVMVFLSDKFFNQLDAVQVKHVKPGRILSLDLVSRAGVCSLVCAHLDFASSHNRVHDLASIGTSLGASGQKFPRFLLGDLNFVHEEGDRLSIPELGGGCLPCWP